MDFLKQQLARIGQQLGGLTASQKMLAASLLVIMVMTLFWWSTFAGRSETAVLLDQPMAPDEITAITGYLEGRGIKYTVAGDRVRVPADRRSEILAGLQYAEVMPADTSKAFDEMIAKSNPFETEKRSDRMWNVYKQTKLAEVLKWLPGVQSASVFIDSTTVRGPNGTSPSATVYLRLKRGLQPDEKMVRTAGDAVAGAVANLRRSRVTVVINDHSFHLKDRDSTNIGLGGESWLASVRQSEEYYTNKLRELFFGVENVLVSVNVRPNNQRTETLKKELDSKNVVHKPISEETINDETKSAQRMNEPGVVPNGGLSIADASAGADGNSSTTEKSKSEFQLQVPSTEIKKLDPGGDMTVTNAVVRIPRSYFAGAWKKFKGASDKEPTEADIEPFIAKMVLDHKLTVKNALAIESLDSIHVEAYHDPVILMQVEPQAAATTVSLLVADYHVKEIVLGALALLSLFMVSNVVKKSAQPAHVATSVAAAAGVPTLRGEEDVLGEATEGAPLLDGVEMDPDAVKAQEMLNQVSHMVNENPDAAAAMIKRWLNR